jgi:hypothetical protein
MKLNVWEVRFKHDSKGQRMAYTAAHKHNWSEFRMASHRYNGGLLTGKNELEALTGEFQEINMRDVTVTRRKHGKGMFRFPDERGMYTGAWQHGLRHGRGTELNEQGRFQGTFRKDWRRGGGTQTFASGDVFRGGYGLSVHHPRESLLGGDEYADGLMHGSGKLRFVDGSVYEGEFLDGAPCGEGRYTSAAGYVAEGTFGEWATLHGYGSVVSDEVTRICGWRHGVPHGPGASEMDGLLGTFEGDFAWGEKHGYGRLFSQVAGGPYDGWFQRGMRDGRGVLNFGHVDRDKLAREAKQAAIAQANRRRAGAMGRATGGVGPAAARAGTSAAGDGSAAWAVGTAGSSDGDVNTSGDSSGAPRQSEYEKMQGDPLHFIPYRGDYCYEGRWRAGGVRTGGLFTRRNGRPEPSFHSLMFTYSGANVRLPLVPELVKAEEAVTRRRSAAARDAHRAVLERRLLREGENMASYAFWKRQADRAMPEVRARTARGRSQLEAIKAAIKKPERLLADVGADDENAARADGGGEEDDDFDDNEDEEDEEDGGEGGEPGSGAYGPGAAGDVADGANDGDEGGDEDG